MSRGILAAWGVFVVMTPSSAAELQVPPGCVAVSDAKPLDSGYADRVVHEKTGIELVLLPAGSFTIGCDAPEAFWMSKPAHRVTIVNPFYGGKTEVTNEQYKRFLKSGYDGVKDCDPAYDLHVRHLRGGSWQDTAEYCTSDCRGLNAACSIAGKNIGFRVVLRLK